MTYASNAQYSRAAQALREALIADLEFDAVFERLQSLHFSPPCDVVPLQPSDLLLPCDVDEVRVTPAARSLNPTSAAEPHLISRRLLRLLATKYMSLQAGTTGLFAITALVGRLAKGDLPASVLPLFMAAVLLPIQSNRGKILPTATEQAL